MDTGDFTPWVWPTIDEEGEQTFIDLTKDDSANAGGDTLAHGGDDPTVPDETRSRQKNFGKALNSESVVEEELKDLDNTSKHNIEVQRLVDRRLGDADGRLDQLADMHIKLAQKVADDKRKEEQRKAEEDAKMMATPPVPTPPWEKNRSRSHGSNKILGMDQTDEGDTVAASTTNAGGDTSRDPHTFASIVTVRTRAFRASPWMLQMSELKEASERQLAKIDDGRKDLRTAWVPCLHCTASLTLADSSCWNCKGLNMSNLVMTQEEKARAIVDENLAIVANTDFFFLGFGYKRGVKRINAGSRRWWTNFFVKRLPKWHRLHLEKYKEDWSPPAGECPSIHLWWKHHPNAKNEINEAMANQGTDFRSVEEFAARLDEFQAHGEQIWLHRKQTGTIFAPGQRNDNCKTEEERIERYVERPRFVQNIRPGSDMKPSRSGKGYHEMARHAEEQYERLGRARKVMEAVQEEGRGSPRLATIRRPIHSAPKRGPVAHTRMFSSSSSSNAGGDTSARYGGTSDEWDRLAASKDAAHRWFDEEIRRERDMSSTPWRSKSSVATLRSAIQPILKENPRASATPAKRKWSEDKQRMMDEAVAYCTKCHDYDQCLLVSVKTENDGRWGRRRIGESCSNCRHTLDERDKWYSCCFRCLTTLCKWCSNEEWQTNGKRLILDVAMQEDTMLPDGPLRGEKIQERCKFQSRGICYAGRFCNYLHID